MSNNQYGYLNESTLVALQEAIDSYKKYCNTYLHLQIFDLKHIRNGIALPPCEESDNTNCD